jgi:hypothetical protein
MSADAKTAPTNDSDIQKKVKDLKKELLKIKKYCLEAAVERTAALLLHESFVSTSVILRSDTIVFYKKKSNNIREHRIYEKCPIDSFDTKISGLDEFDTDKIKFEHTGAWLVPADFARALEEAGLTAKLFVEKRVHCILVDVPLVDSVDQAAKE